MTHHTLEEFSRRSSLRCFNDGEGVHALLCTSDGKLSAVIDASNWILTHHQGSFLIDQWEGDFEDLGSELDWRSYATENKDVQLIESYLMANPEVTVGCSFNSHEIMAFIYRTMPELHMRMMKQAKMIIG